MILALDLGTKTGFALGSKFTAQDVTSGTVNFKPTKFASFGRRAKDFAAWLDRIHTLNSIDEVVYEAVRRHRGTDAAHIYGAFLAEVTAFCEDNGIPCKGEEVGAIKKHASGKGNTKKDGMIAAARSWGFDPKDDNEADALALLRMRLDQVNSTKKQYMGIFA